MNDQPPIAVPTVSVPPLRGQMYEWMDMATEVCALLGLPTNSSRQAVKEAIRTCLNAQVQLKLIHEAIQDWAERLLRHRESVGLAKEDVK